MRIMTGGAVMLIQRHVLVRQSKGFPNAGMATQAQIIYGSSQGVSATGFRFGVTSLAAIFRKRRMLQGHQQAARFGSVRIMAGGAVRSLQIAALMYGDKLGIGLMTPGAERIIILARQSGMIAAMSLVASHAITLGNRRVLNRIGQPGSNLCMALGAEILLRGFKLVGKSRGVRVMALEALAFGGRIMHFGAVQVQFLARMTSKAQLLLVLRQKRGMPGGVGIMTLRAFAGFGR